jgi:RNA polymerase sigma-70 factor, ECF subfamily
MKKMPDRTLSVYLDSLHGYAMVLTGDANVAVDLVLEAYVRGLRATKRAKADCHVKSWLFTILRNIWLNQLRKQYAASKIVDLNMGQNCAGIAPEISEDLHALGASEVEREQLREALEQLPVEFSEIIILREHENLSYQEIGTLMECSPRTAMALLARARSKLRTLLSATQPNPNKQMQKLNEPFPGESHQHRPFKK